MPTQASPHPASRLLQACALALGCGASSTALAQMCHGDATLPDDDGLRYGATLSSTLGAYANAAGVGEYQNVGFGLDVSTDWFALQSTLPLYRLYDDGQAYHGLGDLGVAARATAYRSVDGGVAFGPEVGATLPTGRDDKSLGMGHVMLMPGGWLSLNAGAWSLQAELAYARALASEDAHHHGGGNTGPIVDPMSRSELEHSLSVSHVLVGDARWTARLSGALPMYADGGEAREMFGVGLTTELAPMDLGFEASMPVVGSPYTARLAAWVGAHF